MFPPLPWNVEGLIVNIYKDSQLKTIVMYVERNTLPEWTEEQFREYFELGRATAAKFKAVFPDWEFQQQ